MAYQQQNAESYNLKLTFLGFYGDQTEDDSTPKISRHFLQFLFKYSFQVFRRLVLENWISTPITKLLVSMETFRNPIANFNGQK